MSVAELLRARFFRSEVWLIFGRRRNWAGLAVLAAVPIIIAIAAANTTPAPGDGPDFFANITANGLFVALTAIVLELPLFLPLAVSAIAGDSVAGEANLGTLRYLLPVPVHRLGTTEGYLAVLDGFPAKFAPDERFAYCNSGYVVLALIAERVSGVPFHDLVVDRVCGPAGMTDTAFLRSDELPDRTALGYLSEEGDRTNVLHLPVRGSGDGGVYTTAADLSAFWRALFAGRIVPPDRVAAMVRPRSDVPAESQRYGLGFWLHESTDTVVLTGYDAGVSFRSLHDPGTAVTHTVIGNTSEGAWPIAEYFEERAELAR